MLRNYLRATYVPQGFGWSGVTGIDQARSAGTIEAPADTGIAARRADGHYSRPCRCCGVATFSASSGSTAATGSADVMRTGPLVAWRERHPRPWALGRAQAILRNRRWRDFRGRARPVATPL